MLAAKTIFEALKAETAVENAERFPKKSRRLYQKECAGGIFIIVPAWNDFADFFTLLSAGHRRAVDRSDASAAGMRHTRKSMAPLRKEFKGDAS